MTVAEARAELRQLVDDGVRCPCCTQLAKVYRRPIHAAMAAGLIAVYRNGGADRFVVIADVLRHNQIADFGKLRYWGLVGTDDERREDGSTRTGYWQVTSTGVDWILGRVTVPRYARIYDSRLLGLVGEPVTIRERLGKRFDYDRLMQGVAP